MKNRHKSTLITNTILVVVLLGGMAGLDLAAEVKPQFGIESYFGPNKMSLITPWMGIRVRVHQRASLLFKYYNHNIQFNYPNEIGKDVKRTANLSNFTSAGYVQLGKHEAYTALSFFTGTDSYRAQALDAGVGIKLHSRITAEVGVYLLNEKSVLWYPNEPERNIRMNSFKGGVKLQILSWLALVPRAYFYKNSEDVTGATYSIGAVLSPMYPIYLNILYLHYTEAAQYKFKGDYLSIGLHFYY